VIAGSKLTTSIWGGIDANFIERCYKCKTQAFELVPRGGKLIATIEGWKTIDIHSHDEDDDATKF
jgi:hypothetical protein